MNRHCLSQLTRQPTRFLWLGILAAGIFLSAGCGKKQSPEAATAVNTVAAAVASQPTPPPGSAPRVVPVAVAAGVDASAQLAQLTQVLRRFAVEHRQVPKSLNELVAARYLVALPAAPAGKQFVIEPKHLEVVLQ
jgi:hypothetical protein